MSLSAAPNIPVRTPQPRSSAKNIQLTPIWEEVVRNNRLPSDISKDLIFREISVRLEDLEWPVRQHAFRVLCDIISIIPRESLDEQITQNNILNKVIVNLGHPAPGIRKVASETIQKYIRRTSQTEKMLKDFLQYGVKEKGLVNYDQSGILKENIILGTIITLVEVLKPFIIPENGGYSLSQPFLTDIVEALVEKTKSVVFREKSLEALFKIKEMVGKTRFFHTFENHPEKELITDMISLKGAWSNENSLGLLMDQDSLDASASEGEKRKTENDENEAANEDFSDGTDTETYTKEPAPNLDDENIDYQINLAEAPNYTQPSFVPIEHLDNYIPQVDSEVNENKESRSSSPRVVLAAEIQFDKNKAITMKVMEDESETSVSDRPDSPKRFITESGDLVMKVLHNNEDIDEDDKARTPRRVRFGGEVIKLRTPDSDTTDITIEIHEASDICPRKEPIITITPESVKAEVERPLNEQEEVSMATPQTLVTKREASPLRGDERPKIPIIKESCLSPKSESFDSAPSSSGSEGETGDKETGEEESAWRWMELRVVEENILKDLKNKDNWKIQYQALEQLKVVLINPKTVERIAKLKNQEKINSLLKCLLHEIPQSNNQLVTALALSIVTQLIETLPKELILLGVKDIVRGLCRYVGGCRNLNLKIEAVQSLKMLFGILEPSAVINILLGEGCLFSSSSKLRENSLLAIMYATMTFPSDMFDVDKILEKVVTSVADVRRRVRHGSLEAIAVLSQFCSSQALADSVARVADTLPTPSARAQLIAAVQARLSRRLLPTISSEGLVLYALQIPASRRFGNLGNPMGADVDWILSGTGSVSTGSAKSRIQLNAAQKLDSNPSSFLSSKKWAQSKHGSKLHPISDELDENPWKIQKQRTESSMTKTTDQGTRFYKTQSIGNLNGSSGSRSPEHKNPNLTEPGKELRPDEITWALVPITALEEPSPSRERSNSLWNESFGDGTPHYLSPAFGPLRPMYVKLQQTNEQFFLSKSSDDIRRSSFSFERKKNNLEDFTGIRLLTPTILREKTCTDNYHQNGKLQKNDKRGPSDFPTKIPVLCSNNPKNLQKGNRTIQKMFSDRINSEPESDVSPPSQKPTRPPNGFSGTPAFLPNIYTGHRDSGYSLQKSPISGKFTDVDEIKLQDTMSQLSGLLSASNNVGKSVIRDFYSVRNQSESEVNENGKELFDRKIQGKIFDGSFFSNHEALPETVASAPPIISIDRADQIPSTSSSNSTDFGTLSGSDTRLKTLTNVSEALGNTSGLPFGNYSTYNPKLKGKKTLLLKGSNKVGIDGNQFPENIKPFERPKEGLDTCFNQLESQQWEVNMLGLTSLVRLLRHHPAIVLSQLHPIIVALGRQIRNLRSQVARVACQTSAEMFVALKRNVEPDLEELSGPLFHRSADTNRFIRADCNHALDNMVDNVGHVKAVTVIISKGTTHQNATVRAVAARLLLRLSERAGAEKLLSLPKESRDKMLQAGANLLTEGKLETRAFAKQVFRVWSSHPSFSNLIIEAVQPNVMRHISKTLISLKS